jgi:hypothetical protein
VKEFEVELTIEAVHAYTVRARTPEEAESIAEDLFKEGERGNIIYASVTTSDAVPIDDEPLEEGDIIDGSDNY